MCRSWLICRIQLLFLGCLASVSFERLLDRKQIEFQSKINNDTRINPDQAFESGSYRNEDIEDEPF